MKYKFSWYYFLIIISAMIGLMWYSYDYINNWIYRTGVYAIEVAFNGLGFVASCYILLEAFHAHIK